MKIRIYQLAVFAAVVVGMVLTGVFSAVRILESSEAAGMAQASAPVTVVVDAGHGGEDGGAVSVSGVLESQMNLEIARRVNACLLLVGVDTHMVRESDTALYDASAATLSQKKISDLRNRAKLVNQIPNAVLLSIHQNTYSDSRYSGAQVFYAKTDGSKELAEQTQKMLAQALDASNSRKAKAAEAVYLMKNIQATGILVECGFISNEAEDLKLQDSNYQKKLAVTLCSALAGWISGETEQSEI